MRPPANVQLHAPAFPRELEWLNAASIRLDRPAGRPALIEFWDFGRINCVRTLPYVRAWHDRYSPLGLRVVGVHCPGYSFGRERAAVERAVERLDVRHPVALDPGFAVWRGYGNRGWPARYLFDANLVLRDVHYGEGGYLETELAIQDVLHGLHPAAELPEPLAPLRPEDAPGTLLAPQTADIALPGDRDRLTLGGDWADGEDFIEARSAGASARIRYDAAAAYAVLSGTTTAGPVESDGSVTADRPGLRLHGFQFLPQLVAAPAI